MFTFFKCCQPPKKTVTQKIIISVTDYKEGVPQQNRIYCTSIYSDGTSEKKEISELENSLYEAEKELEEFGNKISNLGKSIYDSIDKGDTQVREAYRYGTFSPYVGFRPYNT